MQLFYNPSLDGSVTQFVFDEEESRHIVKVLRKKPGDRLQITNGKGYLFTAEILSADMKQCRATIVETKKKHQKMHQLHMVVAPTKSMDRFEWFLEKVTEIGVNEITPIICEHSERKVLKMPRLQKIVQGAMKQSLRTYLPRINEPVRFEDFIKKEHQGLMFIAHCYEEEKMELIRRVAPDKDITILIGPEGDFSEREVDLAYANGFYPVSLGDARLRTETAAIVACTTVAIINSR
ncbi:16S rRNA (uracil(1498)-N(3))-methyltransferase [Lentiprolixibacter aurantiacus]|uniref:Ribosomal RNA small subunit methyltransferase E n=1 Tax=Lentiprolixibacter aurantiacus TaxID=2993939 RepID=A0AAE3SPX2_9FLAO|nr:16S rRNA (uracil(1498)-N(3))-methyltransferase [Lentiprolixibacter aurantiacus]MCX2719897.1 16S rRNA (uracil(1498)-N(3))-methyltransferase [Lentiprolixibacter aurantiacus]